MKINQQVILTDNKSAHNKSENRQPNRMLRCEEIKSNCQPDNHLIDQMHRFSKDPRNEIESLIARHTMNEEQWSESLNNIESNENRYQRNSHMTHKVDVIVGPVGWIFAICDVELLKVYLNKFKISS